MILPSRCRYMFLVRALCAVATLQCLLALCAPLSLHAQQSDETLNASEGYRFEVAFLPVSPVREELAIQPNPLLLVVNARQSGNVTIRGDGESRLSRTFKVTAGTPLAYPVPQSYMPTATGEIRKYGITVEATVPVTMSTQMTWQGNRTATLHLPVRLWGKRYHTFNSFQDEFVYEHKTVVRSGHFMIVANKDNTTVTIRSRIALAGGQDLPGVAPNMPRTFTMKAHEVIYLAADVVDGKSHTPESDPTGTEITSTYPIAVISGHAKGSVGMFGAAFPLGSGSGGHRARGAMAQAMLPDDMAGTEFVTVPIRRRVGTPEVDYDKDTTRGDMVRFVATMDDTKIYGSMGAQGLAPEVLAVLDAGESYMTSQKSPRVWTASHPVLCMQYARSVVYGTYINGPQPPLLESASPFMMVVPSTEQGIQDAAVHILDGLDGYMSIAVPTEHLDSMYFDSVRVREIRGSVVAAIPNSSWSSVSFQAAVGNHRVHMKKPGVRFVAWTYSTLWGMEPAGSYGTPVAIGQSDSTCTDQPSVRITTIPTAWVMSATAECSLMKSFTVLDATNVLIDSVRYGDTISIYAIRANIEREGSLTVRFFSWNGTSTDRTLAFGMQSPAMQPFSAFLSVNNILANDSAGSIQIYANVAIDRRMHHAVAKVRYDPRIVRLTTPPTSVDVESDTLNVSTMTFTPKARTAGLAFGTLKFTAVTRVTDSSLVLIDGMEWFDSTGTIIGVPSAIPEATLLVYRKPLVSVHDQEISMPVMTVSLASPNTLVVSYDGVPVASSICLYDISGRQVRDLGHMMAGAQGTVRADVSGLSAGMYMVRMVAGHNVIVRPIFVE